MLNTYTDVIVGSELSISYNGKILAFAKGFSQNIKKDMIDATSSVSGNYKEFLTGIISWDFSVDGLMTRSGSTTGATNIDYNNLLYDLKNSSTPVQLFYKSSAAAPTERGNAYITSLDFKGSLPTGEMTYSAKFQGTGALTTGTV